MKTKYTINCKPHLVNKTELFADIKEATENGLVVEIEDRVIRHRNGLSQLSLFFGSTNRTKFKGEVFKYEYKPLNISKPMIEVNGKLFNTVNVMLLRSNKLVLLL